MSDTPNKKPNTQIVKRPVGERIADILNLDEAKEWLKKAIGDVSRKYFYEIGVGLLQKILYRNNNTPNAFTPMSGQMINYNAILSGNQPPQLGVVTASAASMSWGVPSFTFEEEAERVRAELIELSNKSYATMYDLYDLSNQPSLMTVKARKYGFRNLDISNTSVEPYNGRFIIRLPEPIKLS